MLRSAETIERLLRALGEKMDLSKTQPLGLVVCGGAALNVAGIVSRPTIDIDVVALASGRAKSVSLEPAPARLPDELRKCVSQVGADFGLDEQEAWINTGPRHLFEKGLPEGIENRLKIQNFGQRLRVYWVTDRRDMVCFKLYAAANRGARQQQHVADLEALAPSEEELEPAIEWCLTQNDAPDFKQDLKRLLADMGHEDLAYYIA